MLKMFTTQLTGLFTRIREKEEFDIEDGARLLAQAPVGEGKIYIAGFGEMGGIADEALHGAEPLQGAARFTDLASVGQPDRVLIFTRYNDDPQAVALARELADLSIPFVAVSGLKPDIEEGLEELADVHLDTRLIKPMLPAEDGTRVGFPSSMAGLYLYFALRFSIEEMLEEYGE